MRVLFCCDRLRGRGGAEVHFETVLRAALDAGYSALLATGGHRIDDAGLEASWTIKGLSSAVSGSRGLERLRAVLADCDIVHAQNLMNPDVTRLISSERPTLVTVQDHRVFCPGPGKTLPDGAACGQPFLTAPCESCLPDSDYRRRLHRLSADRLESLRGAQKIVVLSSFMATELAALGLEAEVIPPWVAVDDRPPILGEGFLIAGRLVQHKGVELGIQAWRQAGSPLGLALAGSGPAGAECADVDHLGWLDREAMRRRLHEARALILPSRWQEPFGLVAIEAMALGTPVITFAVGGTFDWSDQGCRVAPAGDLEAMAAAIAELAGDDDATSQLGHEGKAMVRERFSQQALWPRLEALYGELSSL